MKTLYWLTRDLRLHDNTAMLAASQSDMLLLVYVVDPRWFKPGPLQCRAMGDHRWRFLWQSLMALEKSLRSLGQRLHIAYGEPETVIPELVREFSIARVIRSRQPGTEERGHWQSLQSLQDQLPKTVFQQFETLSLFTEGSLPMALEDLPGTFSQFRKQVQKTGQRHSGAMRIRSLTALPPPPGFPEDTRGQCPAIAEPRHPVQFRGGEDAGLARLNEFVFQNHSIVDYKQTRNALDTWEASSKFSPWLANGCLSAKEVAETIGEYERTETSNESTYWLWFELLWREYYYWYALRHGANLFRRDGVQWKEQRKRRQATFYGHRFMAWCQGDTEYPLVNAAMNQLRETGYMSNRGRQLVASCFVNELELDWRYGAAWFQQQLIDYDVSSNWGNWQYLAGVGADPRGLRQFSLEKQARQYDPDGEFVARWNGRSTQPVGLHLVDAADWPV